MCFLSVIMTYSALAERRERQPNLPILLIRSAMKKIVHNHFVSFGFLFLIALATSFEVQAQVTPLCATPDEVHFECDYEEMLSAIRLYEDTLSGLLEETISEKYWLIETLADGRIWFTYDCDTLYYETLELMARIEAARVPPVPPGTYDPCSNFLNVMYYGVSLRCDGGATGERDYLDNCWFDSNLQTMRFANGDSITDATEATAWQSLEGAGYALYRDSLPVLDEFGLHYTPAAILDSRSLCPPGWTLPDSTQLDNLQTWANESDKLVNAQRRGENGEWAEFEPVHIGGGNYEDQPTTQFYALSFQSDVVPDSLPYFANNSSFHLANPIPGRMLGADESHGASVRCVRMNSDQVEANPEYQEWLATPRAAAMEYPVSYYIQMPHVHTLASSDSVLRGEVFYTGPGAVSAVGFVWGSSSDLASADSVTADVNDYPPAEWAESWQLEVLDSIFDFELSDLEVGTTYYYSAWAENHFGYSFGDTLQFTYELPPFDCGVETVTYNGHVYGTTQIGDQCWFSENLQTSTFADGTSIPEVADGTEWQNATTAARCAMSNEASTVAEKGYLYNQFAVVAEENICPTGWHVPSDDEWKDLERFLGVPEEELDYSDFTNNWRGTDEDLDLKSAAPAWDGNNSTGYSALPLGSRGFVGDFYNANSYHFVWTSTHQIYRALTWGTNGIQRSLNDQRMGASVRCLLGSGAAPPSVTTAAASAIGQTGAMLHGAIVSEGDSAVTQQGFIWGLQPDLNDGASLAATLNGGMFEAELTELAPDETHYFTAYATSEVGTTYGDTLSFTTLSLPSLVETGEASGITEAQSGLSGTFLVDEVTGEISEAGFVWGRSSDLSDSTEVAGTFNTGSISATISSLEEGTTYYYVAFINDDNGRSYGDTMTFRTGLFCSDETMAACGQESLVYQGVEYNLVGLGDQCWFRDNLRADNYADGTPILRNHWSAQFDENTDASDGVVSYFGEGYPDLEGYIDAWGGVEWNGYLYSAYAVQRPEGLCPEGWRVPTLMDLVTMEENLVRVENGDSPDWSSLRAQPSEESCFRLKGFGAFDPGGLHFNDSYAISGGNERFLMTSNLTPPPYQGIVVGFQDWGPDFWMDEMQMASHVRCIQGERAPVAFACGHSTVSYAGYDYETVLYADGSCWFQENLRTETYANGDAIAGDLGEAAWLETTAGAQAVYEGDSLNLETFGRLYNHFAIRDERGVCPTGWHVSTNADWDSLIAFAGGTTMLGHMLKSFDDWDGGGTQTSFEGLPAGFRGGLEGWGYSGINNLAVWWANQESPNAYQAMSSQFELFQPVLEPLNNFGYSVRCVKEPSLPIVETRRATRVNAQEGELNGYVNYMAGDEAILEVGFIVSENSDLSDSTVYSSLNFGGVTGGDDGVANAGTIYLKMLNLPAGTEYHFAFYAENGFGRSYGDTLSFTTDFTCGTNGIYYDNHYYPTVEVGDDCWMKEDLRVTIYRDGSSIPSGLSASDWSSASEGAVAEIGLDETFRLYNHMALTGGELCPAGYRLATDADWTALETAVSGDPLALLAQGIGPSTNDSGFSANVKGWRNATTGEFEGEYQQGYYWTASQDAGSHPWHRKFDYTGPAYYEGATIVRSNDVAPEAGMSVRCLKE